MLRQGVSACSIEKVDPNGNSLWTKSISKLHVAASALKIDPANNLIVVGNFTEPIQVDNISLTPAGQQSFCILKFSPTGNLLNGSAFGSGQRTFANALDIAANGEYLIGGGFIGNLI